MNTIPYYNKDVLSLKSESSTKAKEYQAPQAELSDNIQKYDKKVATHTEVSPKTKEVETLKSTPTAGQMLTDSMYNSVGKLLGVDTLREWSLYYDKVYEVVELAKQKSGLKDSDKLSSWIYQQLNNAPALGGKKISDVHTYLKMGQQKLPEPNKPTVKKVVKPKESTEQFVNRWMEGQFNGS